MVKQEKKNPLATSKHSRKLSGNYFLGDWLGNKMAKVPMTVQLESSMLSMAFIMIGLILTGVYSIFYLNVMLWFKITTIVNIVAGIVFMGSYLTTTFQAYRSAVEIANYQKDMAYIEKLNNMESPIGGGYLVPISKVSKSINTNLIMRKEETQDGTNTKKT